MPRTYGYAKVRDRCYDTYNWNAVEKENVIGTLINNSSTACKIVNGNIDSDKFITPALNSWNHAPHIALLFSQRNSLF